MVVYSVKSALVMGLLLKGMVQVHRGRGDVVVEGSLVMGMEMLGTRSLDTLRLDEVYRVAVRVGELYGEQRVDCGLDKELERY